MVGAGLQIIDEGFSFGGQFRYVEARPAQGRPGRPGRRTVAADLAIAESFAERRGTSVSRWRRHIDRAARPVVLWGAGAKGVAFLNAVDQRATLTVVDLNPRKWGKYLPCAGHQVVPPNDLQGRDIDSVLITNAIYRQEIVQLLDQLHVSAPVVTV